MSFSFQGPQLGLRLTWAGTSTDWSWYKCNIPKCNSNCWPLSCVPYIQLVTYTWTNASFTGVLKNVRTSAKTFRTWSKFQNNPQACIWNWFWPWHYSPAKPPVLVYNTPTSLCTFHKWSPELVTTGCEFVLVHFWSLSIRHCSRSQQATEDNIEMEAENIDK